MPHTPPGVSTSPSASIAELCLNFKPGERVRHADPGEGVVIAAPLEGFVKVFFPTGERQLPVAGLTSALSRSEIAVVNAKGDHSKRALRAWLCYQALTIGRTKPNCSMLACSLRICAGGCLRVSRPRETAKPFPHSTDCGSIEISLKRARRESLRAKYHGHVIPQTGPAEFTKLLLSRAPAPRD
jgi:hypothetical protein